MSAELAENNVASISGIISSELEYSHKIYGESFYNFYVVVMRLSKSYDTIPVTISERIVPIEKLQKGKYVEVNGQFRSYNMADGESRLMLTLFVKDINIADTKPDKPDMNQIELNGFICKQPVYRVTPFNREIADILLAVNRPYNRSDYIPCILWGRNARFAKNLSVGDNIRIFGRVQSREYEKVLPSGETETRVAYEVSVSRVELVTPRPDNFLE